MTALLSDEQLLRLMLSGDAEAFEALYDRRQGGIYRYALRMSGSQSMAEDITQDVFLSLMRDRSDYQPTRGTVKSYLYGMARHRLLRRLDRERTLLPIEASRSDAEEAAYDLLSISDCDPFADLERDEVIGLVRQAVLSLPPHFREVVVLCYLQEMNYAEAAEVTNCPIGTVRSRLARARALLVGKLGMYKTPELATANIKAKQAI